MLEGAPIWDFGFAGFRLGDYLPGGPADQLYMLHPYRPGRIPLVLVHGTFSSPATWAQLVNELENDPKISKHYQPWLFIYNSGNPVPYSGGVLVETLRDVVKELDPNGADPTLQQMVVVGHSQGGLLTKLTAVDSGNHLWDRVSKRPLDQLDLPPESRELLQRSLFFEPLPFVKRVVFMSTPHHGSYLSDFKVVSWISRLVQAPVRMTKLMVDLTTHGGDEFALTKLNRPPTSLDNMASNNRFLLALAELPIAPGIRANSIIAVRGDGPALEGGDGVVKYQSAHIDGVESEKVVFGSGHSVQEKQEGDPGAAADPARTRRRVAAASAPLRGAVRTGSRASTGWSCAGWSSGSCAPARRPSRCRSRTGCCRSRARSEGSRGGCSTSRGRTGSSSGAPA